MTRIAYLVIALLAAVALLSGCGSTPAPGGGNGGGDTPDPVATPEQPLQLGSGDTRASFELENVSTRALDWTIEVREGEGNPQPGAWFTIEPRSGRLGAGETQVVTLSQMSGLAAGRYTSLLRVIYEGGVTSFDVIGEVVPDSSEEGDGSITGYLRTTNAEIPLRAPQAPAPPAPLSAASAAEERPAYVPGQLLVAFEPSASALSARSGEEQAEFFARQHGLELLKAETASDVALIETGGRDPLELAAELEADPAVRYAEPNYIFYPHALPNDPYLDESWQLPAVGAPVAWQAPTPGGGAPVVAVIDSGIDVDHPDFAGIFASGGYDFCASSGCDGRDGNPRPDVPYDTHGTHVTGLLAAVSGNGMGIAGVAAGSARIVPIKVFDSNGFTTAQVITEAIRWAAGISVSGTPSNPDPADIITLSLGATGDSSTVREAIAAAQARGALIIASAGNEGQSGVDYPARYDDVIGVGSVNTDFERSCFSDYGSGLDLMAPGGDGYRCSAAQDEAILSTFPGNDYGIDAGTSMAAPLVAGAAALVWHHMSSPSADEVRERLLDTAYFDGSYMSSDRYGAGIVRIDAALGFPGPGDEAAVQATGPSTALDTVVLQPDGTSTQFSLGGLAAGSYTVAADAAGRSLTLVGSRTVNLSDGEDATGVTLTIER